MINISELTKYKEENKNIKIAVAMSGGVDSSTVAYLLKAQGYNIIGITMKTCKEADEDAKKVCDELGIEYYLCDVTKKFKTDVMDYFVDEYLKGKTPNPCMICNRYIKFGELLEFSKSLGAKFMATGHYAKMEDGTLAMGNDPKKDQVYFLSQIKKENLKHIIFPIGELEKPVVRELAKELGVRVYNKKDSQEICFVEDGMLKEFLNEKSGGKATQKGNIVDEKGEILGSHNGISFYTIGQRKGLGISKKEPLYVIALNAEKNEVIVGSNEELFKDKIIGINLNLLTVEKIKDLETLELYAKTRSRDMLHPCSVKVLEKDRIEVTMIGNLVRAVTPGQGIVLYDKENKVVASAFII
ncbi:MAG: tRNA 2-thiouridine(34) synthase MnmA [Fusobacteriaceae bacterium]